jgi:hypothetical protein
MIDGCLTGSPGRQSLVPFSYFGPFLGLRVVAAIWVWTGVGMGGMASVGH